MYEVLESKGKHKMNMNNIIFDRSKVMFHEVEDGFVVVNPDTVRWCFINKKEKALFDRLDNNLDTGNKEVRDIALKLLVKGVVSFEHKKENLKEDSAYFNQTIRVYFEPTSYCNLSCVYCYAKAVKPNELIYDTVKSKMILERIIEYPSVDHIVFTGGEPLLRADTLDLAEYVRNKNIGVSILTNAMLINEENVKRFSVFNKGITISLDAHLAEINDKTRGKGVFDKVIKSIKLLRHEGLDVRVTTVISKTNNKYINEIMDYVHDELDIKNHNMSTHISMGRGAEGCIECSTEEVLQYRKEYFNRISENSRDELVSFIRPNIMQGHIRHCCGAGIGELFVRDNGDVYPCRLLTSDDKLMGNLETQSLTEILEGTVIKKLRQEFNVENIEGCMECSHKNLCGGGCRSSHSAYTGSQMVSADNLCTILKYELDSAIIMDCGYHPITGRALN